MYHLRDPKLRTQNPESQFFQTIRTFRTLNAECETQNAERKSLFRGSSIQVNPDHDENQVR